ncbi:MAG: hypothetical protein ACKN9T_08905 [Candidatus Methylumidiphilus sp.]
MFTSKLKTLTAAVAWLAVAQSASALTPWTDGAPPTANTIYVSGGAAADLAYAQVVNDVLAVPGSLHVFGDASSATSTDFGGRWLVYYFTGSAATGALAGQPIALVKRSLGAAGYGVIPVISAIALEELDISSLAAPGGGNTTVFDEPTTTPQTIATAAGNYRVVVNSANASTLLPLKQSDAGILGVDAKLLLRPGTKNYPVVVPRVGSGADVFPTGISNVPANIAQVSTGGLVYGVGVTSDLYKVLQAAQKRAGQLPASTAIGDYEHEGNIPSLPRNFIGSLLAGKIKLWDEVKIVDKQAGSPTLGQALALTHPSIIADAGVSLPTTNAVSKVPVAVGNRNAGAAIGAIAYAKFLNYPWTTGAFAPPSPTNNAFDATSSPIIKDPGGSTATGRLLNDWNQGLNASGLNSTAAAAGPAPKRWGVAINDATRNASGTVGVTPETAGKQNWRYVRIDGYLPKIENIASGGYPHWGEGVLLYNTNTIDPAKKTVLDALGNGLASPSVGAGVNSSIVHTWGTTGVFAFTKNTSYTTDIPFNPNNPVVGYTHNNGAPLDEIVPVISDSARANGVLLQGLPQ